MGNTCDKIEDCLWLGDKHTYVDPDHNGRFEAIVTAMLDAEIAENNIKEKVANREWLHIVLDDDYRADVSQHFLQVIQFIDAARKARKPVLVHCAGGVSRSATLVAAYLMWEHEWTRKEALEYIIARRRVVDPNDGFMDQLLEFQNVLQKLREKNDIHVDQQIQEKTDSSNV